MKGRGDKLSVLVLRGGPSAEREVSLAGGSVVACALQERGFTVREQDINPADLTALDAKDFDVVFPVLHGAFGEDGQLQRIMDERGICYAGSDAASSQLAMDKYRAKAAFRQAALGTAEAVLVESNQSRADATTAPEIRIEQAIKHIGFPCVVKPNAQGSSIGVVIAQEHRQAADAVAQTLREYGDCLVERYIQGRELTVGIVADHVLPVLEVRSSRGFYDYQAKYADGNTEYVFDIDLDNDLLNRVAEHGRAAFAALGCRDLGRVDMIVDRAGDIFLLEVNTIPGFTDHSLVPKAAAHMGLTFGQICEEIVRIAHRRSIKNA